MVDILFKRPSWAEFLRRRQDWGKAVVQEFSGSTRVQLLISSILFALAGPRYSGRKGLARYWIDSVVANNVNSFYDKGFISNVLRFHLFTKYKPQNTASVQMSARRL